LKSQKKIGYLLANPENQFDSVNQDVRNYDLPHRIII